MHNKAFEGTEILQRGGYKIYTFGHDSFGFSFALWAGLGFKCLDQEYFYVLHCECKALWSPEAAKAAILQLSNISLLTNNHYISTITCLEIPWNWSDLEILRPIQRREAVTFQLFQHWKTCCRQGIFLESAVLFIHLPFSMQKGYFNITQIKQTEIKIHLSSLDTEHKVWSKHNLQSHSDILVS